MEDSKSFFEELKSHRESKNIEIPEICEFTKINSKYITAIEMGDFTILPNVYVRLFLKAYTNYIGADSAKALNDYELYTKGKITSNDNFATTGTIKESIPDNINSVTLDSKPQIFPKQIITAIGIIIIILATLWWASKVTDEQTANLESNDSTTKITEQSVLYTENELKTLSSSDSISNLISSKENTKEIKKKYTVLPNALPLNDNDFLPNKKKSELTEILQLSPPYKISIITLQETKLNISKIEDSKIIALINQTVPSGKKFIFEFSSILNFEFWNGNQISVNLNDTSIDNFISNNDLVIRGSYEANKSQLYLSYYQR